VANFDEWEKLLFAASYDGVLFDCVSTNDDVSRVLAQHEYPFRDGAVLRDMGGAPRTTQCEIVFIAIDGTTDHLTRFKKFKNLLDAASKKDRAPLLFHPLTGSFRALPGGISFVASASQRDFVSMSVTFVEQGLDAAAFRTTNDQSVAAGVVETSIASNQLNSVLMDTGTDTELSEEVAANPVAVGDVAIATVTSWEENPSITPRQVNLELNAITNEITDTSTRLKVAQDVRRYPTYLALQGLHAAVRDAADLTIQTGPKVVNHTVIRTEPLISIMTDIYGGATAIDRYNRTRELNDIPNPSRVVAGTELTIEKP
jgi:prophage DNA circulation protein